MNTEERKKRNAELAKIAPIPDGIEDLRGITWINKYNQSLIKIVRSEVSNVGLVCWFSDTEELFFTRDLNNHWIRLEEE
tara:strand:- start:1398 stop:1634 length:237 start_codon:yes stop_codon:yes gene_type:complete